MVTWGDVVGWQPAPLQASVGPINDSYNRVIAAGDDLRDANTPDSWIGEAAAAAARRIAGIIDGMEEYAGDVAALRRASMDVGDAITGIRHAVNEINQMAAAHHFSMASDGTVMDQGGPPGVPPDERKTIAAELRDRIDQAIRSATDVDDDFCAVLDRILAGAVVDETPNDNQHTSLAAFGEEGARHGGLTIPPPPPEGATPTQNAAYWATLSEAQRTQLAHDRPQLVGPRDGFSTQHRDIANRELLAEQRTRLQGERAEVQRRLEGVERTAGGEVKLNDRREFDQFSARLTEIEGKLAGLEKITSTLADPPDTPENRRHYLLGIDASGDGKAIVSTGNPDTAVNVATYVPGTGSDLATIGTSIDRADAMHDAASTADAASSSAVVAWMGYDAPDSIPDAVIQDYAHNGKQALSSFQQGLNEAHTGPPVHNTVVGHSYGTTVVGLATRDEGLATHDIINVGSPGMGVHHASQLPFPGDHIYSIAAENDPVPHSQAHGNDPSDPSFGGRVIQADPGPSTRGMGYSGEAHSAYWNPDHPELWDMGKVIAGQQPG